MAGRGFPEGEVLEGLRWEARRRRGTGRGPAQGKGGEDGELLREEADDDASRIFVADGGAAATPDVAARGGGRLVAGLRGRLAGAEATVERLKAAHAGRDADAARLRARVRELETERRIYRGKLKVLQRAEEPQGFLTPGGGGGGRGGCGNRGPTCPCDWPRGRGRELPPRRRALARAHARVRTPARPDAGQGGRGGGRGAHGGEHARAHAAFGLC